MKRLAMSFCFVALLATSAFAADPQGTDKPPKLIDRANMDTTVNPCDNFYQYANGNWQKNTTIPADYSSASLGRDIRERNSSTLHTILEEAAADRSTAKGTPRQKIGDFYRVAMDTRKIEADRAKPLEPEFAYIDGLRTPADVQNAIIKYHRMGLGVAFTVDVMADMKNPDMAMLYIHQGGLGLPDRDYYTKEDPESEQLRQDYVTHVANMLELTGRDEATAKSEADRILALETRLAQNSLTNVELQNPAVWYQLKTVAQADSLTPDFSWDAYLKGLDLSQVHDFSLVPNGFFTETNAMLTQVPIDDWKAYFRWQLIHWAAPYLSTDFVNEDFTFFSTRLRGIKELLPRWKRALEHTERAEGELLGQLFVGRTFPPRAKEKALDLVQNLLAAMKDRIQAVDWMSDSTKQKALEKLAAFTPKIGYPDKWRDYSGLDISPEVPYVENAMRGLAFEQHRQLNKVGKPVDKTEWAMTPQTVDAYYNPLANEIAFPAGILQPPIFDSDADDPSNYGAIGSVIGHEITHGFDDIGSQFGATGAFQDWWTVKDKQEFEARTARLVDQYNQYLAIDSQYINGKLTLGENIADLGGVLVAYYALHKALAGKPRQEIDGFTPEQRFFLAYTGPWRAKLRPEALKLLINTNPHSPPEFRVLGPLANVPEFQQAFNCPSTSNMVSKPENIVKIW